LNGARPYARPFELELGAFTTTLCQTLVHASQYGIPLLRHLVSADWNVVVDNTRPKHASSVSMSYPTALAPTQLIAFIWLISQLLEKPVVQGVHLGIGNAKSFLIARSNIAVTATSIGKFARR
jgi:hypothetical protein